MVQVHSPETVSAVTGGAVTTTGDLIEYLADGGWHWSSVDHF
jgi:hypothetical protein